MNIKTLTLATFWTAVLAAPATVMTQNSIFADAVQVKQQTQETAISLRLADLKQPHILKVSALTATQFTGEIELDGKFFQKLKNNSTQINMSPSLTQGRHTITISGEYRPSNSSVSVEFIGPNTQVSQQTGGSGYINQTLIIEVRE